MEISTRDARKIFLNQQGLLKKNSFGRGKSAVSKAIHQLGYLQIDTISVVNRAHEHVLQSRIPGAGTKHLNELMKSRDLFEYWSHAAAFLPMTHYRFSTPVMNGWGKNRQHDRKLARRVVDRIRSEGPLQSRDFEAPEGHRSGGWWDWKPTKRVLEHLYLSGELMVSHRDRFQKVYDLKENVLPGHIKTSEPTIDEWSQHLVLSMVNALGIGTEYDIGYAKSSINRLGKVSMAKPIREAMKRLVATGRLIQLEVAGKTAYTTPGMLEQPPLRVTRNKVLVLSPFDNLVINRRRTLDLFDFNYQLECYLPESKRQYGYFALPLLYGDELIGRMDAKAERPAGNLSVRNLVLDAKTLAPTINLDAQLISALSRGIRDFAEANNCQTITINRVSPGKLKPELTQRLKELI